jgi:hypothetical protein
MKWKITHPNKEVEYIDPDEVSLTMGGCILKNNSKSAKLIFNGANKRVCATINCNTLIISEPIDIDESYQPIRYNPRINPFWVNHLQEDIDGTEIKTVVSFGYKLWEMIE